MNINLKLNPFGNADDHVPALFYPKRPFWIRQLLWWGRNPLHNFTFHWIGIADHVVSRQGNMWGDGFNVSYVSSRHLDLPLLSYRGKYVEWYIGWRPNGGFGVSLRRSNATGY